MTAHNYEEERGNLAKTRMLTEVRIQTEGEAFTADCLLDLVSAIEHGTRRMIDERRLEDGDLELAAESTRSLVEAMREHKQDRGFDEFREETLSHAYSAFCPPPIWPLCRD